jgi:hypothetical protein
MADNYTDDLTTAIGQVRLKIGDDKPNNPLFTDTQISAFLSMEGSEVDLATAAACEAMAARAAPRAVKVSMEGGKLTVDRTKTPAQWRELARYYRSVNTKKPAADHIVWSDETLEDRDTMKGQHEFDPQDQPEE